jgi:hypothetical protein
VHLGITLKKVLITFVKIDADNFACLKDDIYEAKITVFKPTIGKLRMLSKAPCEIAVFKGDIGVYPSTFKNWHLGKAEMPIFECSWV